MELQFLFSAHRLMMVYICTKFHENILNGIKVIEYICTKFHENILNGIKVIERTRLS